MNKIDTHVHIDLFDDLNGILNQFEKNKIYALFVTNLPELFDLHQKKLPKYKYIRIALGYHPSLSKKYKFNKDIFDQMILKTKYIGEVGLDNKNSKNFTYQKEVFNYICSNSQNKVLSIHSRNAELEAFNILKENNIKHAIFHWYSGGLNLINEILENGYYFSINPSMLESKNGLKILSKLPQNKILFESDGPFSFYKKAQVNPSNFSSAYKDFSDFYKVDNIENVFYNNFKSLLSKLNC